MINLDDLFYKYYRFIFLHEDSYFREYNKLNNIIDSAIKDNYYTDRSKILGFYYYIKYYNKIAPWFLHLCITDFCQLKCKHCYFGDHTRLTNVTSEDVNTIIYKFFKIREYFLHNKYKKYNTVCNIAGGEPLVHPNIISIINSIPNNSFDTIKVLSNGYEFNDDVVKILLKKSNRILYQFSLDGLENNHNYIRGEQSYKNVIQSIKKARKTFPELYIQIAFNAHHDNYHDTFKIAKLAKELGCNKIFFDRYVPYWDSGLKILTQDEFIEFQNLINQSYDKLNDNSFLVFRNRSMQYDNNYSCMAGLQNQVCEANGNRLACTRYHLSTGNFYTNTVEELIENSIKAEIKTQLIPEECISCKHVSSCKGGMKCLSFAKDKQYSIKDINCSRYIRCNNGNNKSN